jgi:hypothetical protein
MKQALSVLRCLATGAHVTVRHLPVDARIAPARSRRYYDNNSVASTVGECCAGEVSAPGGVVFWHDYVSPIVTDVFRTGAALATASHQWDAARLLPRSPRRDSRSWRFQRDWATGSAGDQPPKVTW